MTYPHVVGEAATLARVLAGCSLARYGDGEFHLCANRSIKCQRFDHDLGVRMREILLDSGECLVGIPNIRSDTPKKPFWTPFLTRSAPYLTGRRYYSSFITRPDSGPWIDTPAYWSALESLWVGQHVTLVRGSLRSLLPADLVGAASVREILGPPLHAWSEYEALLKQIGRPDRALLCLGPTATVMAVDLCAKGVHAIDIGHIGIFLRKHRRGDAMTMTPEDHALLV